MRLFNFARARYAAERDMQSTASHDIHVSVATKSHIGRIRSKNEDASLTTNLFEGTRIIDDRGVARRSVGGKGVLLVVSDGMGGAESR